MFNTLPNWLTLSRVMLIPILVGLFFFHDPWANWAALTVFALAAATDFFDGLFARMRQQQSSFGRFLDPVADKLLVSTALFMLVAFDRITGSAIVAGVIILCREIVVSGLREFLGGRNIPLPVTPLAKWKTAIQMLAIGFLLIGDAAPESVPVMEVGVAGLWAAAVLTVVTGFGYLRTGIRHMARVDGTPPGDGDHEAPSAPFPEASKEPTFHP